MPLQPTLRHAWRSFQAFVTPRCLLLLHPCRFIFEHGVLTCDTMPQPTGTPEGTLQSKLLIERVIIIGLPSDKTYSARSTGNKMHTVVSGAGVDVRLAKGSAVVVRAVNLPLASDWSLRILEGAPQVAAE
jgi:hypothetical protein